MTALFLFLMAEQEYSCIHQDVYDEYKKRNHCPVQSQACSQHTYCCCENKKYDSLTVYSCASGRFLEFH